MWYVEEKCKYAQRWLNLHRELYIFNVHNLMSVEINSRIGSITVRSHKHIHASKAPPAPLSLLLLLLV